MVPPALRPLDIRPFPEDPDRLLVIDPLELQPDPVTVPLAFLAIARHFDGTSTVAEIALRMTREGQAVSEQAVTLVAEQMANFLLLQDARALEKIETMERLARSGPRPARLAGRSYPALGPETATWIDGLLAQADPPPRRTEQLAGFVLPHIDPRLGGATYARGYRSLVEAAPADVYVVLGIGHAGLQHGISLAPVDFATPLGPVPADREICDELVGRLGDWILADPLVHQREHSVEFQAVFLRHLAQAPFTMVPLLTAFGPNSTQRIRPVLKALRDILAGSRKCVTVVASVDFSHIGPMYGDRQAAGPMMGRIEDRDRTAIDRLVLADDAGFWHSIHADGNSTRICGHSSVWSMLQLVAPRGGTLLDYGQAVMDREDSRVTFAAMSFFA